MMRDIDVLSRAMEEAQAELHRYVDPGDIDPQAVLQRMLEILDREDVVAAQQRLSKGYGRLTVVK